jgi:hypothetical protein
MSKIREARAAMDVADYVVAAMVESKRTSEGVNGYANPVTIAALIGGATRDDIRLRLRKMKRLGVLEMSCVEPTYQVTNLGCQLLLEDVGSFEPTKKEVERRDRELAEAVTRS